MLIIATKSSNSWCIFKQNDKIRVQFQSVKVLFIKYLLIKDINYFSPQMYTSSKVKLLFLLWRSDYMNVLGMNGNIVKIGTKQDLNQNAYKK